MFAVVIKLTLGEWREYWANWFVILVADQANAFHFLFDSLSLLWLVGGKCYSLRWTIDTNNCVALPETVRLVVRCCTASWPRRSTGPGRDPSRKPTFLITSSKNPSLTSLLLFPLCRFNWPKSYFLFDCLLSVLFYLFVDFFFFLFFFLGHFLVTKRRLLIGTILSWKNWWIHCPSSMTSASQLTGWLSSCDAYRSSYAVSFSIDIDPGDIFFFFFSPFLNQPFLLGYIWSSSG